MANIKSEGFFGGKSFLTELHEFKGKKVNVNIGAEGIVIRVTGGTLVEIGKDFIQLDGKCINVIYFIPGFSQPVMKKAEVVVIPAARILDVEKPEHNSKKQD